MAKLGHTALGTWSGGRFMNFGAPLDDERLAALLRPDERIHTVITADAYGAGEADALLGRALRGVDRSSYELVGAIGHDFYTGEREGAKGFPRFTDPRLRGPEAYGDYGRLATRGWRARSASPRGRRTASRSTSSTASSASASSSSGRWSSSTRWSRGPASSSCPPPASTASSSSRASSTTAACSGTTSGPATSSRRATTAAFGRAAGSRRGASGSSGCGRSPSATG